MTDPKCWTTDCLQLTAANALESWVVSVEVMHACSDLEAIEAWGVMARGQLRLVER